jgi:uncharacterized protein
MARGARRARIEARVAGRRPVRTCVACRSSRPQDELLRLTVVTSTGSPRLVPDAAHRAPGRGAYLCARPDCIHRAAERDAALLRRALRAPGSLDTTTTLDVLLERVATTDPEATPAPSGPPQP